MGLIVGRDPSVTDWADSPVVLPNSSIPPVTASAGTKHLLTSLTLGRVMLQLTRHTLVSRRTEHHPSSQWCVFHRFRWKCFMCQSKDLYSNIIQLHKKEKYCIYISDLSFPVFSIMSCYCYYYSIFRIPSEAKDNGFLTARSKFFFVVFH